MRRRWISLATALFFVGNLACLCAPGRALAATPPPPTPQVPVVFVPGTAASFLVKASDPSYVYWFSAGQLIENSSVLPNIASTANADLIGNGASFGAWAGAIGCAISGIVSLLTLLCGALGALVGAATGSVEDMAQLFSAVTDIKPSDSSDLNRLALNPDGSDPSGSDVVVGDVFRTLKVFGDTGPDLPASWGSNIYQTFFDTLKSWGYDDQVKDGPNKWLYVAPYDWRKDATTNARQYLLPVVLQALHDHYPDGGGKVVLIAHSQGGLVARSFIAGQWKDPATGQTFRGGDRVAALIAIATPWFGTPRVTQAVSLGWDFGIGGVNAAWAPRLAPNWPSVYDMMPADDPYFGDYPGGYYYQGGGKQGARYGEPPLPEDQQNAIISEQNTRAGGNLMAQALAWRAQVLNGRSYGVANYLIAGYIKPGTAGHQIPLSALGEDPTDTIIRVVRYDPQGYHCFFWHCWTYQKSEQDYVDLGAGDNTVPLASALAWSPSNGPLPSWPGEYDAYFGPSTLSQSVIGPASYYLVTDQTGKQKSQPGHKAKHMHLPNNHNVLQVIHDILSDVLVITSTALPAGQLGQSYSTQLTASGGQGPYTWSVGALPGWSTPVDPSAFGLTLSPDGTLSGTLLSSFALPVTVTDGAGNTGSLTLDVQAQTPPMAVGPMPSFDAGAYNSAWAYTSGGVAPIVDGQKGVPDWLTIQCSKTVPGNCLFSGTPPKAGTYGFQLHLFDTGPSTGQWVDEAVVVHPQPSFLPPEDGIWVAPGQLIQRQLQATDGLGPYRWSVSGPDWLQMSQHGLLSGTPPSAGRWTVNITVNDAVGGQASNSVLVTAMDPLAIATTALPDGTVGQPYVAPPFPIPAVPLRAAGGVSPYTWSMTSACLKNCAPCVVGSFHPQPGFQATYGARVVPLRPEPVRLAAASPAALAGGGGHGPLLRLGGRGKLNCPKPVYSPLPPGLKLVGANLQGIPQRAGTFALAFTVTDSISDQASVTLSLVVDAGSGGSGTQPTPPSQPSPSTQTNPPGPAAPPPVPAPATQGSGGTGQSGTSAGPTRQPQEATGPTAPQVSGSPAVTGVTPASGPDNGGQRVTITGSGLSGATTVNFGDFGQGTNIQVAPDGSSLQVVTPQAWWGDGPVYVQVTTPGGQSTLTPQTQYTYEAQQPAGGATESPQSTSTGAGGSGGSPSPSQPPAPSTGAPVVTGISPSSGPDSGGQAVTLTGSNLTGATGVNFGDFGQAQNLRISPDGTSMQVTTPEDWWGDGPVYVQVTTPQGQSVVTSADQYTYQPAPAPGSTSGSSPGS